MSLDVGRGSEFELQERRDLEAQRRRGYRRGLSRQPGEDAQSTEPQNHDHDNATNENNTQQREDQAAGEVTSSSVRVQGTRPPLLRPRYPLLVKLTGYRLLNMLALITFGLAKSILSYEGYSVAPNTLDWVLGVVLGLFLYWLGLYEDVRPPVMPWLFKEDYTPEVIILPSRFIAHTMYYLFISSGILHLGLHTFTFFIVYLFALMTGNINVGRGVVIFVAVVSLLQTKRITRLYHLLMIRGSAAYNRLPDLEQHVSRQQFPPGNKFRTGMREFARILGMSLSASLFILTVLYLYRTYHFPMCLWNDNYWPEFLRRHNTVNNTRATY